MSNTNNKSWWEESAERLSNGTSKVRSIAKDIEPVIPSKTPKNSNSFFFIKETKRSK